MATKCWRWLNIRVNKILATTKYSRRQHIGIGKILVSTKCWHWQNVCVNKILVSTKCACAEASPYCFGLAESTAADFSQTTLMFSYFSQKVLIPPRAVTKWTVAAGHPAFMGRLSPARCRLILPVRLDVTILVSTKYWRPPPPPALASRWHELPQALHTGHYSSTIFQLSLSLSPPSSAAHGVDEKIRTICMKQQQTHQVKCSENAQTFVTFCQ
jgi:hypothetical protein